MWLDSVYVASLVYTGVWPTDGIHNNVSFSHKQFLSLILFNFFLWYIVSTVDDGSLRTIISDDPFDSSEPYTDHEGVTVGSIRNYSWLVGHIGDDNAMFQAPSVLWLKNGIPLDTSTINTSMINTSVGINGTLTTTFSLVFAESDAGVYQCVFTDTTRSESIITTPLLLHTGK